MHVVLPLARGSTICPDTVDSHRGGGVGERASSGCRQRRIRTRHRQSEQRECHRATRRSVFQPSGNDGSSVGADPMATASLSLFVGDIMWIRSISSQLCGNAQREPGQLGKKPRITLDTIDCPPSTTLARRRVEQHGPLMLAALAPNVDFEPERRNLPKRRD